MPDKVLLTTLGFHLLFLATGALMLGYSLVVGAETHRRPADGREAVRELMHARFPLSAGVANGVLVMATFVLALPGLLVGGESRGGGGGGGGGGGRGGGWLRGAAGRSWLRYAAYLVGVCAVFTLCLGVVLWVMTLRIRDGFYGTYAAQDPGVQSMIQTSFGCCGYFNSSTPAFVTDLTCPSPAAAALLRGCATSISSSANIDLDVIFTSLFGIVGVDSLLLLSITALLKVRRERERYYHIDQKGGFRQF